jgi:hypothetical protein
VQGAQGDALADSGLAGFVNDAGSHKFHTAVEDTVADSVDLIRGLQDAEFGIDKDFQHSGNGLCVGGHGDVTHFLDVTGGNSVVQTAVQIDALAQTLGKDIAGVGIHELVLQRRAACVDYENFHVFFVSNHFLICFFAVS